MSSRQADDEGNESYEPEILGRKAVVIAADAHELLIMVILANRRDQDAARRETLDKCGRDVAGGGGHEDPVIGHLLGPTFCPVTESTHDVPQAQLAEPALGVAQQL